MNTHPTVIVLAHAIQERPPAGDTALSAVGVGSLQTMLTQILAADLPVMLVAPAKVINQARGLLPGNCLVELPPKPATHGMQVVSAMAAGVHASAQANGWLMLPATLPMLQPDTLKLVARGLQASPIAYPQYQAQRGQPMGFGRELFSELIRLGHDRDFYRLISRYPSEGVDVDDPGVLLHSPGDADPPSPALVSGARGAHRGVGFSA
jgi:molybdenum cofactor cytidylyltransferase